MNFIGVKQMKKIFKIIIGALLLLLLGLVSWKTFIQPTNSDGLTAEEANQIATDRFNGEITDTKLVDGIYELKMKKDTGEYDIKIASKSGEMIDVVQTKEKQVPADPSNEKGKQDEDESKKEDKATDKEAEEPAKNISSEEAIQIALDTVYGEVDDVDLEDENGQLYYFIEIETSDDLEAEIQIHAITGEVISIEWDD